MAPSPKKTPTVGEANPVVTCQSRKSNADEIFVRHITTDEPPTATRLGSGWVWDFGAKKCITSVEFALLSNPPLPGLCTQVVFVSSNPAYDPELPVRSGRGGQWPPGLVPAARQPCRASQPPWQMLLQ